MVDSAAAGKKLFRRTFHREPKQRPAFGVLLVHGWGDHLGRHRRAAQLFVDQGGLALGVDWPGNGKSAGLRGHMTGIDTGTAILDEKLAALRVALAEAGCDESVPLGIYAHSTGVLVALKWLASHEPSVFRFAWLTSPLVRPEVGHSRFKRRAAAWLSRLVPWLPIDTRVRASSCRRADPETGDFGDTEGCHPLISVGLGHQLASASESGEVMAWAQALPEPLRMLMILGTADTVCPPEYGRELFAAMPLSDKTLIELQGFRHELLGDPQWPDVAGDVEAWLEKALS